MTQQVRYEINTFFTVCRFQPGSNREPESAKALNKPPGTSSQTRSYGEGRSAEPGTAWSRRRAKIILTAGCAFVQICLSPLFSHRVSAAPARMVVLRRPRLQQSRSSFRVGGAITGSLVAPATQE